MVLCAAGESSQFAILGRTAQILAKTALLGETSTWSSQPPQYLPPPVLLSYYKQHVDLILIFAMQAHQNSLENLYLHCRLSPPTRVTAEWFTGHTWAGRCSGISCNLVIIAGGSTGISLRAQYSLLCALSLGLPQNPDPCLGWQSTHKNAAFPRPAWLVIIVTSISFPTFRSSRHTIKLNNIHILPLLVTLSSWRLAAQRPNLYQYGANVTVCIQTSIDKHLFVMLPSCRCLAHVFSTYAYYHLDCQGRLYRTTVPIL